MEKEKNEEKETSIPESKFNLLMSKIEKLESDVRGEIKKPKRVLSHTATLREWNDKLVVGNVGVKEVLNDRTMKEETKIDLLVIDGENKEPQKKRADLLKYLNEGIRVNVKIISQIAKEEEKIQGAVTSHPTDEVFYRKNNIQFNHEEVPLSVTSVSYTSKIKVLDGKFAGMELEINNKYLND